MAGKSRLRRTISRWANADDGYARDMRAEFVDDHNASIAECPDRQMVTLRGSVRTVTVRPRGGVPALEAELYDGSGSLTILWLGRRRIAGIDPGRSLQVQGRIGIHDNERVMYNPKYELLG
ncbi:OB-fold nucleic acid binding domain-containing protein [Nocardioides marinquilinus]|uniref:OB-fold nucleic acid binding domain-containing protein n=1 Tax=Nocardioides marinquilinus TaxID=1210400 RepID=A0ABP9PQW2_9ACTN